MVSDAVLFIGTIYLVGIDGNMDSVYYFKYDSIV